MATLAPDIAQRSGLDEPREATLDALVARTWSTLRVTRRAACLLCGGEVEPSYGAGPHPVGGTCRSCGTEMG